MYAASIHLNADPVATEQITGWLTRHLGHCQAPDCPNVVVLSEEYRCFHCSTYHVSRYFCLAKHMQYIDLVARYGEDFQVSQWLPPQGYCCYTCIAILDAEYKPYRQGEASMDEQANLANYFTAVNRSIEEIRQHAHLPINDDYCWMHRPGGWTCQHPECRKGEDICTNDGPHTEDLPMLSTNHLCPTTQHSEPGLSLTESSSQYRARLQQNLNRLYMQRADIQADGISCEKPN